MIQSLGLRKYSFDVIYWLYNIYIYVYIRIYIYTSCSMHTHTHTPRMASIMAIEFFKNECDEKTMAGRIMNHQPIILFCLQGLPTQIYLVAISVISHGHLRWGCLKLAYIIQLQKHIKSTRFGVFSNLGDVLTLFPTPKNTSVFNQKPFLQLT